MVFREYSNTFNLRSLWLDHAFLEHAFQQGMHSLPKRGHVSNTYMKRRKMKEKALQSCRSLLLLLFEMNYTISLIVLCLLLEVPIATHCLLSL